MAPGSQSRGSVTAEFVVVIPAVIVVLGLCLATMQVSGQQVRLQDAAAVAARALGRSDQVPAFGTGLEGASLTTSRRGPLLCARLSAPAAGPAGSMLGLELNAESCALSEMPAP